ncbi:MULTISPECIES: AI-2E family transporter [unclassified Clostridium]|uniref:AI-2E family transporter n=1 Tax=unclassified Clostridium TaxID=2614128 RepID=UPI0025BDAAD9|nr:AI-2E family transporter [Clostridium sp.]MCI6692784.1 AI-2E family transporter [Clostridium sp.]MDY2631998.1 AI-2E family transporter [Clostridium sp.]MDY4250939.1 AI-2E family transporter [Clostridium sp.]
MKLYNTYGKIINLLIIFIIISIITIIIKNYFKPFFILLILVFITNPIYKLLLRSNITKSLSAIISIILVNLSFFIILFYFGNRLFEFFYKFYRNNMVTVDSFINSIKVFLNLDINKTLQSIGNFFNSNMLMKSAIFTGDGVISYFLANVINFFILIDKEKIYNVINKVFPENLVVNIISKSKNLRDVFKIEIKLILFSALIITIGFKILGIPNSLFLGSLCAIFDILPFVGTTIVFIPIIIYNIIMKRYLLVVGLISLYILERFTREILEAKFLSSKLDIHPIIVIVSIYVGVNMFGFIGIIAGPIYSIIAKDLIYKD